MTDNIQTQPQGFDGDTDELFQFAMKKKWDEVLSVCKKNPSAFSAKLTKSEETVLHLAVSGYHAADRNGAAASVSKLLAALPEEAVEILKAQNDKGNTPLHLAAALGGDTICNSIASKDRRAELIKIRNKKGETPLFLAAHHGKMDTFLLLHELYNKKGALDDSVCRRNDGDTILHSAISGEYFQLASEIISKYPKIVNSINEEGFSPLHILARKPNVFESSSNLRLYDQMIYKCVHVDKLKKPKFIDSSSGTNYPDNYRTCVNFFHLSWAGFRTITASRRKEPGSTTDVENPKHQEEEHQEELPKDEYPFPANYTTCIQLFKLAMTILLVVLGIGSSRISKIRKKKKKHQLAVQIMDKLIYRYSHYKYSDNGGKPEANLDMLAGRIAPPPEPPGLEVHLPESKSKEKQANEDKSKAEDVKDTPPKMDTKEAVSKILDALPETIQDLDVNGKRAQLLAFYLAKRPDDKTKDVKRETPILLAATKGIKEVVEKVLETFPVAIQDLDANEKNALLLAIENRKNEVFQFLMSVKLPEFALYQVDNQGNSAIHLAAKYQEQPSWRIPGAALQMQWEIKWYKYVKEKMSPQYFIQYNKDGETAKEIFRKTHEKLVKDGSEWMIKTSESCSVVAALIATVAFATSSTIPGGNDQNSGHPVLQKEPIFNVFSITSIVALCFSVTALVFFLSILTSRCQQRDFRTALPRRLLFGLTSLFTSISAILVSFCAGHFFTLSIQIHNVALPVYAVTCLPITFFAFAQLRLYIDLLWSIVTKVPIRNY